MVIPILQKTLIHKQTNVRVMTDGINRDVNNRNLYLIWDFYSIHPFKYRFYFLGIEYVTSNQNLSINDTTSTKTEFLSKPR